MCVGGKPFNPQQVSKNIGVDNDGFVAAMLSQPIYKETVVGQGDLIKEFPDMKRQALLSEFVSKNTLQSYVYGMGRLWFKESVLGDFERGYTSEVESCKDHETRTALRLDHAGESLRLGDLAESIRLVNAVATESPSSANEKHMRQPELDQWLHKAKNRLSREENVNAL